MIPNNSNNNEQKIDFNNLYEDIHNYEEEDKEIKEKMDNYNNIFRRSSPLKKFINEKNFELLDKNTIESNLKLSLKPRPKPKLTNVCPSPLLLCQEENKNLSDNEVPDDKFSKTRKEMDKIRSSLLLNSYCKNKSKDSDSVKKKKHNTRFTNAIQSFIIEDIDKLLNNPKGNRNSVKTVKSKFSILNILECSYNDNKKDNIMNFSLTKSKSMLIE